MAGSAALRSAVELVHMPSRVRVLRQQDLPEGVVELLQIAAGDDDAVRAACEALDRPSDVILDAAHFFIEQVLLAPDSSSYRVLGGAAQATTSELRRNMALLLRFLHPDVEHDEKRSAYAGRVTRAWEDLKTTEARQAYDLATAAAVESARAEPASDQRNRPHKAMASHHRSIRRSSGARSMLLRQIDARPSGGILRRFLDLFRGTGRD